MYWRKWFVLKYKLDWCKWCFADIKVGLIIIVLRQGFRSLRSRHPNIQPPKGGAQTFCSTWCMLRILAFHYLSLRLCSFEFEFAIILQISAFFILKLVQLLCISVQFSYFCLFDDFFVVNQLNCSWSIL